jgi:RimJ/RimL family protein N-acetyltransferase
MSFSTVDRLAPAELRVDACVLQPLRAADVERDYEAVMASQDALRARTGGRWPRPDFTLAENLADLHEHEADFAARRGFTYTILDPDETRCLGCVYVYPRDQDKDQDREGPDEAMVWFWVRPECVEANLDQRLLAALVPWLQEDFAFTRVLIRASANDARQLALMRAAGLREADRRLLGSIKTVLFE